MRAPKLAVIPFMMIATSATPYAHANAWDVTPFIGLKGGYQITVDDQYQGSDPDSALGGLYGGFIFSESWRWDIGYQYHDELTADSTHVTIDTRLWESALRYDWALHKDVSLYGRVGAAYWEVDKQQGSVSTNSTGTSPLGEVGVDYHITPSVSLSTGYQYLPGVGQGETGSYDSHALVFSLAYQFNTAQASTTSQESAEEGTRPSTTDEPAEVIPVVVEPEVKTHTSVIVTSGGFASESATLEPSNTSNLAPVAQTLNQYPQAHVDITGHTDSTGPEEYNQRLSEQRASFVANQLIQELSVSPEQVRTQGVSSASPIASNDTKEGRAQNRRVELTIPAFEFTPESTQ